MHPPKRLKVCGIAKSRPTEVVKISNPPAEETRPPFHSRFPSNSKAKIETSVEFFTSYFSIIYSST